jgi:hypothetical protein
LPRALLQTPLSPRRAMFRKESRGESRHTIAETSNSDRWRRGVGSCGGASAGLWPAFEPSGASNAMRVWRSTMPEVLLGRRVQPAM